MGSSFTPNLNERLLEGGREGGRGEIERCGGDITSEMRIASSEVHSEIFMS